MQGNSTETEAVSSSQCVQENTNTKILLKGLTLSLIQKICQHLIKELVAQIITEPYQQTDISLAMSAKLAIPR